ncbi:ATP-binding cassette domain-containing protein [Streptomyces sp. NPDC057386]|uniref:ABC transporter ATP-binding protein n=1 Tax=unclassified Streptomyces TaxID=2593676 RepID=UPI0036410183
MIQALGLTSIPRKDLPPAVDDVSFEAHAGHITTLLGGPGAGKTTALRLMLELQQGRGVTYFRGRTLHRIAHPSREVGVLLGDVPGHPARTVRGHLRMLCAAAGVPVRRADEVLEAVGLVSLRDQRLGTLSRGMDRRLGLACALLPDPHTLVLDAPAQGLSARESRWLYGMLRAHAEQGGTVLLTTRDPKEAARTADRVVTLEQGRLVADQDVTDFARTRLRPRVAVRTPHAARLAAVLTKEARTGRRSVEVVQESGNLLSVYGSTCAHVGETAFRHGILVHRLADEIGDMGPGAGATADGIRTNSALDTASAPTTTTAPQLPSVTITSAATPVPGTRPDAGTAPTPSAMDPVGDPGEAQAADRDTEAGTVTAVGTVTDSGTASGAGGGMGSVKGTLADSGTASGAGGGMGSANGTLADSGTASGAGGGMGSANGTLADSGTANSSGGVTGTPNSTGGSTGTETGTEVDTGTETAADLPADTAADTPTTAPTTASAPAAPVDSAAPLNPAEAPQAPPAPETTPPAQVPGGPPPSPLPPLLPPISVRPAPSPLRPLRYELRRATGVSTGFVTAGAVLVVSAVTAVVLARIGHTPQPRLLAAWPREVPLPPAALGAGLLGALAFGDEFRHPALAADRGTVPRRLGLLAAKLLVSAATALLLALLTVGCDAEVLYLVYGRELVEVPADWAALGASWVGLVVGCAWAGVLAAGVFRSTTAGLAAVVAVPVAVVPLVHKVLWGAGVRTAVGFPARAREVFLLRWPFGGGRHLAAAVRVIAQPVGTALALSVTVLLCTYLLVTVRRKVR